VSGDGGLLFSAAELETAVRLKCNFVDLVWIDGAYNIVRFNRLRPTAGILALFRSR
jgi:acetolactate synthase-1/2/3 large subunit